MHRLFRKAFQVAKGLLPSQVRASLQRLRRRWQLRKISIQATRLHEKLETDLRGVRPIRVLFLVSNLASWKVGPVFRVMLNDPEFEPIVLVCPVSLGGLSKEKETTARILVEALSAQGFPYVDLTKLDADKTKAKINTLSPHLFFFTNPHGLVPSYLHDQIFTSFLTCYVPYNHECMEYGGNQEQYNQTSHNWFWRIFVPHEQSLQLYKENRFRSDAGVILTGFPACEPLLVGDVGVGLDPWKAQPGKKKRVIYAPHWLWRKDIRMATIDAYGKAIMRLAERYKDDIQWAMRPHPLLKPKLNDDPNWGEAETAKFFDFWERSEFSQLHQADYESLFRKSDAMIHDSGSFLAEYLYLQKPVLYLMTEQTNGQYLNAFGRRALSACEIGKSVDDIERFLIGLLEESVGGTQAKSFFDSEIASLNARPPSLKICEEIKSSLSEQV